MKLYPKISPIKVGVFPLTGDENLVKIAKDIDNSFRACGVPTYYDDSGTIGRRYARMDEIGTPFCVTIDHDTIKDKKVTIRDRDTTEQVRKKIDEITSFIKEKISL